MRCGCWKSAASIASCSTSQSAGSFGRCVIDKISDNRHASEIPLVMYSDEPLLLDDAMTDRLARSASIRHVQSPERLLDEISLLLASSGRRARGDRNARCWRSCTKTTPC